MSTTENVKVESNRRGLLLIDAREVARPIGSQRTNCLAARGSRETTESDLHRRQVEALEGGGHPVLGGGGMPRAQRMGGPRK